MTDYINEFYHDNRLNVDEMTDEQFAVVFGFNRSGEPGNYTYSRIASDNSMDGLGAYDDDFLSVAIPDDYEVDENSAKAFECMKLFYGMSDEKYTASLTSEEFNEMAGKYVDMMSERWACIYGYSTPMFTLTDDKLDALTDDDIEDVTDMELGVQAIFSETAVGMDTFLSDMGVESLYAASDDLSVDDPQQNEAADDIEAEIPSEQVEDIESVQEPASEPAQTEQPKGVWNSIKSKAGMFFSTAGTWIASSAVGRWASEKLSGITGKNPATKYLTQLMTQYGADKILQQLAAGAQNTEREAIEIDATQFDSDTEIEMG